MKQHLLGLGRQILEAVEIGRRFSMGQKGKICKVIFMGVGGSAASGDILRTLMAPKAPVPLVVNRSPALPAWVDDKTLAIASSYSGNTKEVLHAVSEARRRLARVILVTSGGRLSGLSEKFKIPCLHIPPGLPPRCAIGYLTFSVVPAFTKWGWISMTNQEVGETVRALSAIHEARVLEIARQLFEKFVHVYASSEFLEPVAFRWRTQLAENSKTLASHHTLPEMLHNEIEGWRSPKEIVRRSLALFLTDKEEPSWSRKRRHFAAKIIRSQGAQVLEIPTQGKARPTRLFSLISLGDRVSEALAKLEGVDPVPVPVLEAIKKIQ